MAANANLHRAKNEKNDEFYTQLTDVAASRISTACLALVPNRPWNGAVQPDEAASVFQSDDSLGEYRVGAQSHAGPRVGAARVDQDVFQHSTQQQLV